MGSATESFPTSPEKIKMPSPIPTVGRLLVFSLCVSVSVWAQTKNETQNSRQSNPAVFIENFNYLLLLYVDYSKNVNKQFAGYLTCREEARQKMQRNSSEKWNNGMVE